MTTHSNPGRTAQRGASLLEVLIAVLILAIGMLGIAALQAVSLRNTQSSGDRTTAVIQSYSMLDMLRANRVAARGGQYDQGYLCAVPDETDNRIDAEVGMWIASLQEAMGPTACGAIDCAAETCEVKVRWNDSRATAGEETHELVTETRL
ncbi:type IV pilus modification protein PilV [Arenimonas terrae]|jgi:type IV pilus assembly protein PilV|uniref:Type IV pilus modification protein PilV n=1 Tax=Arenimonas terrae TaxID=2546226 RepID=A0A5C4RR52_9GAMM|nr:type IV pilus modification protein PilV [Arenimonas terrae]TNJ33592.1 type IV pilus modification protein PilV [Arenimonas terrae]